MLNEGGQFGRTEAEAMIESQVTTQPEPAIATVDWDSIRQQAESGALKDALKQLSSHYHANLPQAEKLQMYEWLDLLAGRVIYSTEHHLQTAPYVVTDGDTLESLAARWQVPAQLIYNVNRSKVPDPTMLVPGTELKAIQGPFNAVVNLEQQKLTLFVDGMYAGRFPIELGQDGPGLEHGSFQIQQKAQGQVYQATDGQSIAAGAADNPYGGFFLKLSEEMAIHEANPASGQMDNRGSIRLSSRDAADVFGILSTGSQVTIQR